MRPNLSVEKIAGALAVLGTSVLISACGGGDKPSASPVDANEVAPTGEKASGGDGHCGADKQHKEGEASCAGEKKGDGSCGASKGGAASCGAAKTGTETAAPADAKPADTAAAPADAKPADAKPAEAPKTDSKKPAGKKAGGASCGAGTCSAKK